MPEDGAPDLDRIWRYAIRPLLEERFYGARRPEELERDFGLAEMRSRLSGINVPDDGLDDDAEGPVSPT